MRTWNPIVFGGGGAYNPVYDPNYDVAPESINDWRRFLTQATMGYTMAEVDAQPATLGAWIDSQMALDADLEMSPDSIVDTIGGQFTAQVAATETYRTAILTPAQFRMRCGHAMSQLIVAGHTGATNTGAGKTWRTGLNQRVFGNYKELMRWSVVHTNMGLFLNNRQNNARNGVRPNQNFARELLQLFSLSQEVLDQFGDPVIDPETGFAFRTYVQSDIDALSRMLCGFSYPGQNGVTGSSNADGSMRYAPLLAYNGEAVTFLGKTEADYPVFGPQGQTVGTPSVNGYTPTEQNIIDRIDACLTIIMEQPTIAPFVCKRLITRMVTDNPSREYIRRVVAAFENDGTGVRGNMGAVFRAIALDQEARGSSKPAATYGRFVDPTLFATRVFRYVNHPSWTTWDATLGNGNQRRTWFAENGLMHEMNNWEGNPQSVFGDGPADYVVTEGFYAPYAAIRGTSGIAFHLGVMLSEWNKLVTDSGGDNATWGTFLCTDMIAFYDAAYAAAAGDAAAKTTAANAALVDRVFADLHQGRAPSTLERDELLSFAAHMDGLSYATRRKAGYLLGSMTAMNKFWVNV
jgi:uncharacterized protein (DUF1800 family)